VTKTRFPLLVSCLESSKGVMGFDQASRDAGPVDSAIVASTAWLVCKHPWMIKFGESNYVLAKLDSLLLNTVALSLLNLADEFQPPSSGSMKARCPPRCSQRHIRVSIASTALASSS
jgi:hypothetical protein